MSDFDFSGSGMLEPVKRRDYAEHAFDASKIKLKVDSSPKEADTPDTDSTAIGGDTPAIDTATSDTVTQTEAATPERRKVSHTFFADTPDVPSMTFEKAEISGQEPIAPQLNGLIGQTTSEWIWSQIENGYPIICSYMARIDGDFVKKAKLPPEVELELLEHITKSNAKNKSKFQIDAFHRDNILPPLAEILSKKGWEKIIPPELKIAYGVLILAFSTYWNVSDIKDENRLMEKRIRMTMQAFTDSRSEEKRQYDADIAIEREKNATLEQRLNALTILVENQTKEKQE